MYRPSTTAGWLVRSTHRFIIGEDFSGTCQETVGILSSLPRWIRDIRAKRAGCPTISAMCAHIVLAEDDEQQAELVRRYLQAEQHTVVVVGDGLAALHEVRRLPPDLLILDEGEHIE
jgi:hypothetical protein